MEHRSDLQDLLLDGLPERERVHVAKIIRQLTDEKIRRKRAEGVRDNEPIDLTRLEDARSDPE